MKAKYMKESTKEVVTAEKVKISHRETGKKGSNAEPEHFEFSTWQIQHQDGNITLLSDSKFNKRYIKL